MKNLTTIIFLWISISSNGQSVDSLLREGMFYSNTNNRVDYLTFVTPDLKLAHTLNFEDKKKTFYLLSKSNLISDTLITENYFDRGIVLNGDSTALLINSGRTGVLKFKNGKFVNDTIIYDRKFSHFIIFDNIHIGVQASQTNRKKQNSAMKIMSYSVISKELKELISVGINETALGNKYYPKIYYAIARQNVYMFLPHLQALFMIDKNSLVVKRIELPKDDREWYYYFDRTENEHYFLCKTDGYHVYKLEKSWLLKYIGKIDIKYPFPKEIAAGKWQITEVENDEVVHRLIEIEDRSGWNPSIQLTVH